MGKNLRVFSSITEYQNAELVRPAVSYIEETGGVFYDNVISSCFEIVDTMSGYSDTSYTSVYNNGDNSWYMKNNNDEYEQYGIIETGSSLSAITSYEGKLAAVGTTEYQYSGKTWNEVGTYTSSSMTLTIGYSGEYIDTYNGVTMTTDLKIPMSEYTRGITIHGTGTNEYLSIGSYEGGTVKEYSYSNEGMSIWEVGTITNDGTYYYLSLPTEREITINGIEAMQEGTTNITFGSTVASVDYPEKAAPSATITYATVAAMQADGCPNVGINQLAYVKENDTAYKFTSEESWVVVPNIMFKGFKSNGNVVVRECGYNDNVLGKEFDNTTVEVVLNDCISGYVSDSMAYLASLSAVTLPSNMTEIPSGLIQGCTNVTAITIPSGVTRIVWAAFNNSGIRELTLPSGVTYVEGNALNIPSGPIFDFYSVANIPCTIYVPCASVATYKAANGWKKFASNIYGIPPCVEPTPPTPAECKYFGYANDLTAASSGACDGSSSLYDWPEFDNDGNFCTHVIIGDCVTSLGNDITSTSQAVDVLIGSGITSIGNDFFYNNGYIDTITINATTPPTVGSNFLGGKCGIYHIYVPSASVSAYQSASGWSTWSKIIEAIQ